MSNQRIIIERNGSVARITLNRPEVHNAFDEQLIAELTQAMAEVSDESELRVIVLTGAGASFCAGADLDWMRRVASYSRDENLADSRNLQRLFTAIAESPKVTIARVNGHALGGGAGLVAVCDIAVGVDSAKLGFTEVRLGLAPAVISPYVVEKIGAGPARTLFLTGDRISAEDAVQMGLLHRSVPPADLETAVGRIVDSVLRSGPGAIAATKRLLRAILSRSPDDSADLTVECIADLRAGPEGQEGIAAFLQKRNPTFTANP